MGQWYDARYAWPAPCVLVLAGLMDGSMALAYYDNERKLWIVQPAFTAHYETHTEVVRWRFLPDD